MTQVVPWWKKGIVYQIYPRSFMDSSADGIGDLRGIADRIDYLAWLGVNAIWLSPTFPSPMADFGYDVSDYTDVHPIFGTLADFDHLLSEAHAHDIRIILDLVPNHTSNQHAWFLESRSSRDNPKRNWYIWRDAQPDGSPPNNWLAYFGGSAWTWDDTTQQYYLHNFLPEQPDLNWRNPEVKEAMFNAIRFWLRRGVDGFRVDVIDRMIKDDQFRDNPPDPGYVEGESNPQWKYLRVYSENRPEVHPLIAEMRAVFDEFPDRVIIGESPYSTDPLVMTPFFGAGSKPFGDELHIPFNFALLMLPWDARIVRDFITAYDQSIPAHGWPNYVLGNHDRDRVATRVGGEAQARVAAMLLLTLRGTPFIYYGEELGMVNVDIPPEQYQDPQGINLGISRDPARTPMQWSAAPHAGFSSVETWLPVADDYQTVNIEAEQDDPRSMLALYRRLIDLRRESPALVLGDYHPLEAPEGCIVYGRGGDYVIALNLTHDLKSLDLASEIVLSTHLDREERVDHLVLRADEGVIVRRV